MKHAGPKMAVPALLTVSVLLLAGCGSDTGPAEDSATPSVQESEATATSSATSSATATTDVAAVVATAEGAVEGSRALELEWQEVVGEWEVTVVAGDTEHEVTASADGAQVLDQREDGQIDAEDRAQLERVAVDLVEAVEAARGEIDGDFNEASLDDEDGTLVWEVGIREDGSLVDSAEVHVNAEDGSVIGVDR